MKIDTPPQIQEIPQMEPTPLERPVSPTLLPFLSDLMMFLESAGQPGVQEEDERLRDLADRVEIIN